MASMTSGFSLPDDPDSKAEPTITSERRGSANVYEIATLTSNLSLSSKPDDPSTVNDGETSSPQLSPSYTHKISTKGLTGHREHTQSNQTGMSPPSSPVPPCVSPNSILNPMANEFVPNFGEISTAPQHHNMLQHSGHLGAQPQMSHHHQSPHSGGHHVQHHGSNHLSSRHGPYANHLNQNGHPSNTHCGTHTVQDVERSFHVGGCSRGSGGNRSYLAMNQMQPNYSSSPASGPVYNRNNIPYGPNITPQHQFHPGQQSQHHHGHQTMMPSRSGGGNSGYGGGGGGHGGGTGNGGYTGGYIEPNYSTSNDYGTPMDETHLEEHLKDFMVNMSPNPHLFDEYIESLVHFIQQKIHQVRDLDENQDDLAAVCNYIIDQGIAESQFRYIAVKLCIYLMKCPVSPDRCPRTFSDEIIERCRRTHSNRNMLITGSNSQEHLRGFTVFIAELAIKVVDPSLLLNMYVDLAVTLLQNTTTLNVKTVVSSLKLVGCLLDQTDRQKGEVIFTHLTNMIPPGNEDTEDVDKSDPSIPAPSSVPEGRGRNRAEKKNFEKITDPDTINFVKTILERRGMNWQDPPPPPSMNNPYAVGGELYNTIGEDDPYQSFYGGTGTGGGGGGGGGHDFAGAPYDDYGWNGGNQAIHYDFGTNGDIQDPEVVDAFEEFLRSSGQMS